MMQTKKNLLKPAKPRDFMREAHEAVERRHAKAKAEHGPDYQDTYVPDGMEMTESQKRYLERKRKGLLGQWW